MIDTHTHLDYLDDAVAAISEVDHSGARLKAMICIGASLEHARNAIALAEQHPSVWATVGLHPTDAEQDSPETRQQLTELAAYSRVVGIGESGLDDYWDETQRPAQLAAFEWQCQLAAQTGKPLVIHTRDKPGHNSAHTGVREVLANWPKLTVIFHCFSGDLELLRFGLERPNSYFGFGGNTTYKKAHEIQEAACQVPLERLLFETDAPFLAPVPKRGKKNRPSYVRYTLEFVANLRQLPASQLEQISDENAIRAYQLDKLSTT